MPPLGNPAPRRTVGVFGAYIHPGPPDSGGEHRAAHGAEHGAERFSPDMIRITNSLEQLLDDDDDDDGGGDGGGGGGGRTR